MSVGILVDKKIPQIISVQLSRIASIVALVSNVKLLYHASHTISIQLFAFFLPTKTFTPAAAAAGSLSLVV